ncbi:MAG: hypothetical protein AAB686_03555 [Patescibacteria group bacterium]
MATFVEKKNGGLGIISVLIWLVLIGVVIGGAYYIFFKKPELISVAPPAEFEDVKQLAAIELDPQAVVEGAKFQALKSHITSKTPERFGRSNPFSPP